MRVSRSLTVKQMAMVACVSMVFVFIFCVILLFHFLQQNRYNTATQLESIARSVREPLSAAILKADIPEAETILKQIKPAGVVSRADVVLPNQFQALRMRFIAEHPVPVTITRFFELPIQISLPIYSLERPANPQPLAYLVLQADSWRSYKFIISTLSMLVTTYLLLSLMITVAITWCINRLIVHPLRKISTELNALSSQDSIGHQLALPGHHFDDEIGILVRNYNLNQQMLLRQLEEACVQSTRFPVSDLPNKAFLMALLEQTIARQAPTALLVISCETLRDTAGVLQESQREVLLVTLVEKLKSALSPHRVLAQLNGNDFAIIANDIQAPWQALTLSQQVLTVINERVPLHGIQLRPNASIGVAIVDDGLTAGQLYHRATSAVASAQRKGKNQIQFFDPEQMAQAQQRLTQKSDILAALDQAQFAVWLQPQIALASGDVISAAVVLRARQPDGSWGLARELTEQIESCNLTATVADWVLEESCRLLAGWQSRGIMLPLSVDISARQLLNHETVSDVLALLNRYRLAPQTLMLNVMESRYIVDRQRLLRPLRDAGIVIALDDVAIGDVGLRDLSVDMLNINAPLLAGLPDESSILSAIIHLAHSLELRITVRGVETQAQREWLAEAGVETAQGVLFASAASPEQFEERYLAAAEQAQNS